MYVLRNILQNHVPNDVFERNATESMNFARYFPAVLAPRCGPAWIRTVRSRPARAEWSGASGLLRVRSPTLADQAVTEASLADHRSLRRDASVAVPAVPAQLVFLRFPEDAECARL